MTLRRYDTITRSEDLLAPTLHPPTQPLPRAGAVGHTLDTVLQNVLAGLGAGAVVFGLGRLFDQDSLPLAASAALIISGLLVVYRFCSEEAAELRLRAQVRKLSTMVDRLEADLEEERIANSILRSYRQANETALELPLDRPREDQLETARQAVTALLEVYHNTGSVARDRALKSGRLNRAEWETAQSVLILCGAAPRPQVKGGKFRLKTTSANRALGMAYDYLRQFEEAAQISTWVPPWEIGR